jgi:hypothetical protein
MLANGNLQSIAGHPDGCANTKSLWFASDTLFEQNENIVWGPDASSGPSEQSQGKTDFDICKCCDKANISGSIKKQKNSRIANNHNTNSRDTKI